MKIWKFGIIGAGLIADFLAKAIQHLKNAKLIEICGSNPDKALKLAKKYDCKKIYTHEKKNTRHCSRCSGFIVFL